MDSYQVLKSIHKVGHILVGKVTEHEDLTDENGTLIGGEITLETTSKYKVVLPYHSIFDTNEDFDKTRLPKPGSQVKTVIKNHVDNILYVSLKPGDLEQITEYRNFYDFVEKNDEGQIVEGTVKKVVSFGLFVDIGSPFIGLIDIGHSSFNSGKRLSSDSSKWPKEGDSIKCIIAYYRFANKQIGLGWNPD